MLKLSARAKYAENRRREAWARERLEKQRVCECSVEWSGVVLCVLIAFLWRESVSVPEKKAAERRG